MRQIKVYEEVKITGQANIVSDARSGLPMSPS